jgi:hypothetical protein
VVDSLKALDPNRPIREADNICSLRDFPLMTHFGHGQPILLCCTTALTMW